MGDKVVPLVVYVDGVRQVIGVATVTGSGKVNAQFHSHETADRLGFTLPASISLGPAPDETMQSDIRKLRRQTTPIYRNKEH